MTYSRNGFGVYDITSMNELNSLGHYEHTFTPFSSHRGVLLHFVPGPPSPQVYR